MQRRISKAAAAGLLAILAGCAGFTPNVYQDAKPRADMAYLYGRLSLSGIAGTGFCHLRAGLSVQEVGGSHSYTIEFRPDDKPSAIAMMPGEYRFHSLVFATCDGDKTGENLIPDNDPVFAHSFRVQPGKAYYVADLVVQGGISTRNGVYGKNAEGPLDESELTWQLTSARYNYYQTTLDFRKAYPNLVGLDTEITIPPPSKP